MSDTHSPAPDDAEGDREYMLLEPDPELLGEYLKRLEERGITVETAVVEMPSEQSPGTLSVQFWAGEPERDSE